MIETSEIYKSNERAFLKMYTVCELNGIIENQESGGSKKTKKAQSGLELAGLIAGLVPVYGDVI